MTTKLEKDVRMLKAYAIGATLTCAFVLLTGFRLQESRRQKFEEIDVERINIVEKNGSLRLVISNRERQHPGNPRLEFLDEAGNVTHAMPEREKDR